MDGPDVKHPITVVHVYPRYGYLRHGYHGYSVEKPGVPYAFSEVEKARIKDGVVRIPSPTSPTFPIRDGGRCWRRNGKSSLKVRAEGKEHGSDGESGRKHTAHPAPELGLDT
jgi:hypothetical protein